LLLTKASEYALLSIIIIAKNKNPQPVDTLSATLNISKSFLAKVLQPLARDGILISHKGAKGGFALLKSPENISILDIINSVETKSTNIFECSDSLNSCPGGAGKASICAIWPYLNELQNKVDNFLNQVTLKELIG
jgi:Rrf2 family protein